MFFGSRGQPDRLRCTLTSLFSRDIIVRSSSASEDYVGMLAPVEIGQWMITCDGVETGTPNGPPSHDANADEGRTSSFLFLQKATSICVLDMTGLIEGRSRERSLDLVPATAFATFFP